ncbi:MAG: hypothetical protein ABIQ39_08095 [Ilumatobacteraceae bacterium]
MVGVTPASNPADNPLDLHEWISFDDPVERRTWVLDATFLKSRWHCIYGAGCQGVLDGDATSMMQGCCSYGAHFVDDADVQTVVDAAAKLTAAQWQYRRQGLRDGFLETAEDGATSTRLVRGACVFLNRPGFAAGAGCALHVAALQAGDRPMDWKPDVCWQLPLRLESSTDDYGHVTSTLREWKRRDWGPGGDDFHWWCTESPSAFTGSGYTYQYLRDEIVELVGAAVYDRLVDLLERPNWVPLAHPTVRRRDR